MTDQRMYLVPTPRIYEAIDVLEATAPESIYLVPELIADEIVRSAFYRQRHSLSIYGTIPGIVNMNARDMYAVNFIDLAEEILDEATAELTELFRFHHISIGGDLVDYRCSHCTGTVALRVWDYGLRKL